ncbi:MAG: 50S ribosomal protein L11 methyltransferase [Desulfobacterales bacterium]|nr:50S ribosomal protein L11 methyltransferase [Desulfobacterales bacterium]
MSKNPYKYLYIYYLQGNIKNSDIAFSKNFIGNWQEDKYSFLFYSVPALEEVNNIILLNPSLVLLDTYEMTYEEWQGFHLKPIKIGNFVVVPQWESNKSDLEGIPIIFDPGVVFGTGTHPTTRDCLKAIELIFENNIVRSATDIGTGTGILSIAAAKLGCKHIISLDINFLAAKTTLNNIHLNHLEDNILIIQGSAEDFIGLNTELLIANIHFDVMKKLMKSNKFRSYKFLVLSGLLRSEAKEIKERLLSYPFKMIESWESEGIWHTFYLKNKSY